MSLMRDFFKAELKTVHLKTGIRQMENIMAQPDWEKQMEQLINLMVDESNKPPFDLIGIDIKQRVIAAAVIEDPKFIGMNPKFVRAALANWWANNKDNYYQKVLAEKEPEVSHEPVSWEERDRWLEQWKESLSKVGDSHPIPVLTQKEIQEEGQERPKENKTFPSTPPSIIRQMELHDQWIRECFDTYTGKPNENWMPEEEWIKLNDK